MTESNNDLIFFGDHRSEIARLSSKGSYSGKHQINGKISMSISYEMAEITKKAIEVNLDVNKKRLETAYIYTLQQIKNEALSGNWKLFIDCEIDESVADRLRNDGFIVTVDEDLEETYIGWKK
jgi:hypothetical protein